MNTQPQASALMSVEQAATYVQLAVGTLNTLRLRGGGPVYYQATRRVHYKAIDLDAWMDSHRRQSTSDRPANELLAA